MRAPLVARHYYHYHYYYYGSTNVWMPRVKNKSFGRAANRNQPQHRRKLKSCLYADVNGFLNPSIITGENYRPDLLFLIQSKCLYVLELTVGFESNLNNNAMRKKGKYLELDQRNEQKLQMCEICKPLLKLPWRFLRRMFHVLRHDE